MHTCNEELKKLAQRNMIGNSVTLGSTPMEPVLQWREQVVSDTDLADNIANVATVEAFSELAYKLTDEKMWEVL